MSYAQLAEAVNNLSATNETLGAQVSETLTEVLEVKNIAETAEVNATKWATNPVDVPVTGDQYSALHWAQKAAESAAEMPDTINGLKTDIDTQAQQGARETDFSANCLIRYDILDINGSTTSRGAQDFTFDEINRHIYITEGGAITRYPMDGALGINSIDTTGVGGTAIGHQGLTLERVAGTNAIKLWSTSSIGGRFAARMDYTPNVPITSAEVYELFPVNAFANATSCTPAISTCGRYLIAHGMIYGSDTTNTRIRVFKMSDLLAHGPGDCTGLALYEWSTQNILTDTNNPLQGTACDGQNVYLIAGGTGFGPEVNKRLNVYTLRGELVSADANITIGRDRALLDGDGTRWEPEGLDLVSNASGGLTLMVGMLSGQPGSRRYRIYATGIKKPLNATNIKLINNTGNNFYSLTVGAYSGEPETVVAAEPGSILSTRQGKAFIKRSGFDASNWADLLDSVSGLALLNSFGLATTGMTTTAVMPDDIRTTSVVLVDSTNSGLALLPLAVGHIIFHIAGSTANGHTQFATPLTSVAGNKNRVWHRQMWAGVWTAWQEFAYTDSPIFTGTPTAPTAAATTNTTQLATTAFTQALLATIGLNTSQATSITDLDTALVGGMYRYTNTATNSPLAGQSGVIIVGSYSSTVTSQLALHAGQSTPNPKLYYRSRVNSVWSTWSEIPFTTTVTAIAQGGTGATTASAARTNLGLGTAAVAPLVGTVSQSAGVATGAVVEKGSNANGEYVRFADGTQICWASGKTSASAAINTSVEYTITFPIAFVNTAYSLQGSAIPATNADVYGVISYNTPTTTTAKLVIRNGAGAAQTFSCAYTATGRWF